MCSDVVPYDGTKHHAWVFEAPTAENNTTSFTSEGLENIAAHKYKPGAYTYFDNFFNPMWNKMTELIPLSVAPNMITTIGALHCFFAYCVLWYHAPHLDQDVPNWVIFICGYCTVAYYTFDCMDGKQARRTGTSSPLGQLFDHGFDCICNLAHVSTTGGFSMIGGTPWIVALQSSLQLSFFMAQWEEYYTHILPHAAGNFGVTEVNYGIGLITILMAFIDRKKFWISSVKSYLPQAILEKIGGSLLSDRVLELQLRHFVVLMWCLTMAALMLGSIGRVLGHDNVKKNKTQLSALSKLLSPALIAFAPFWLPMNVICNETRFISVSTGLLCSFLTKKMICFSMAKMTYATSQIEAIPYWMIILWIRYDRNITEQGVTLLLGLSCIWYLIRMTIWANIAIRQICDRLDIHCFTIKDKSKSTKED
jgi:phosphatidylglycerophosphate synthase